MGQHLHRKYPNDISHTLSNELVKFRQDLQNLHTVMDLANFIVVQNSSSWSNFSETVFRIEKKNLRNAMCHNRLSSFAIILIENSIEQNLDLNYLSKRFATAKARGFF